MQPGMPAINAAKTACDHQHELSGANLILITDPRSGNVQRRCRECSRRLKRISARLRVQRDRLARTMPRPSDVACAVDTFQVVRNVASQRDASRYAHRSTSSWPSRWKEPASNIRPMTSETPELPRQGPDWSQAECATHSNPDLWTSDSAGERAAAKWVCIAHCRIRRECEEWSMSLPADDDAVYGSMDGAERARRRRDLA